MIHWLLESAQNMTEPPEAFLSAAELEIYRAFRFEKRRSDWLLGRWTAKRLLQAVLLQETNELLARDALEIFNDADGVPFAMIRSQRAAWNLSISHSNQHALCAVHQNLEGLRDLRGLGADLEYIEPREDYLARDYFTAREQARVDASTPAQRDLVVTAIWSAKEAALKAIHKGLSLDTRAVEISLALFEQAPAQWTRFEIEFAFEQAETFSGWWRAQAGFVLTIVGASDDAPDEFPTAPEVLLLELGVKNDQEHGIVHRRIAETTRHHARHSKRD
jgi:4'-phosphopantetheinyl transferase